MLAQHEEMIVVLYFGSCGRALWSTHELSDQITENEKEKGGWLWTKFTEPQRRQLKELLNLGCLLDQRGGKEAVNQQKVSG